MTQEKTNPYVVQREMERQLVLAMGIDPDGVPFKLRNLAHEGALFLRNQGSRLYGRPWATAVELTAKAAALSTADPFWWLASQQEAAWERRDGPTKATVTVMGAAYLAELGCHAPAVVKDDDWYRGLAFRALLVEAGIDFYAKDGDARQRAFRERLTSRGVARSNYSDREAFVLAQQLRSEGT